MAQRVTIAQASRITGRSERTLRAWLAEDPPPLSVELGNWRGGRRIGSGRTVKKGRSRLLDLDELRALHERRGGTQWHAEHVPTDVAALASEVHDLRQRVERLEQIVDAFLRDQRNRFEPGH